MAREAISEAKKLCEGNGNVDRVAEQLELAEKALDGGQISESDLDKVSAQLAHRVRLVVGTAGDDLAA